MLDYFLYNEKVKPRTSLEQAIQIMAGHEEEHEYASVARNFLDAYLSLCELSNQTPDTVAEEEEKLDIYQEAYLRIYKHPTNREDIWLPESVPSGPVPVEALQKLGAIHGGRDRRRLRAIQSEAMQ